MSIAEVEQAIRRATREDDSLETIGNCRDTASTLKSLADAADQTPPKTQITVVAYPEARAGEDVHYALEASDGMHDMTFNPVPAPGFPRYIGPSGSAPGRLRQMKPAEEVV